MNIDWHTFVTQYGLLGLGSASFLSATLIPLSSEALLIAAITVGIPIIPAFAVCSLGNCLACLLNYGLGAWLRIPMTTRLGGSKSGQRAIAWMERWGHWSLLGSWLPFVGDPLTIVAGTVRVQFAWFIVIVCGLRVMRFVVTLYGAQALHLVGN